MLAWVVMSLSKANCLDELQERCSVYASGKHRAEEQLRVGEKKVSVEM